MSHKLGYPRIGVESRVNYSALTKILGKKYIDDHCKNDPQATLVDERFVSIYFRTFCVRIDLRASCVFITVIRSDKSQELSITLSDPQMINKVRSAIQRAELGQDL